MWLVMRAPLPAIVSFEPGSATLTDDGLARIDRLGSALIPGRKQLLVLEGHSGKDAILAARRAIAVRGRLAARWRILTTRVEARGVRIADDPEELDESSRSVDVRLIEPHASQEQF